MRREKLLAEMVQVVVPWGRLEVLTTPPALRRVAVLRIMQQRFGWPTKRLKTPCTTADRCAGPLASFLARQSVPPPPLCAEVPLPPSHGQAIGELLISSLRLPLASGQLKPNDVGTINRWLAR
jgi:hypothetical protein